MRWPPNIGELCDCLEARNHYATSFFTPFGYLKERALSDWECKCSNFLQSCK